jgi:hypothetical protein
MNSVKQSSAVVPNPASPHFNQRVGHNHVSSMPERQYSRRQRFEQSGIR